MMAALVVCGCQERAGLTEVSSPEAQGKVVKKKAKAKKRRKAVSLQPQAAGAPYELLVLMDDQQWERPVGRALFDVLDADLPGVAQPERQFRMTRIAPANFSNMFKVFRNIIQTDIQTIYSSAKFKFTRNVYARGQMVMTLQAHDEDQLVEFLSHNGQQILDFFTRAEFNRQVEFLSETHNPMVTEKVEQQFGCTVWVPVELNKFKQGKNFFWASTNRGTKDLNFVIYTYPYTSPKTFTLDYYMQKRDSVMKANIPGGPEGSYMTTQHAFVDVADATVRGEYAQVARGLWRVEGDHMGGPFVAHSRVDVANNRVVVVEGFVYAPESLKRNLITILSHKSTRGWEIQMESEKLYYFTINILDQKKKTLPIPSGKCSMLIDKL